MDTTDMNPIVELRDAASTGEPDALAALIAAAAGSAKTDDTDSGAPALDRKPIDMALIDELAKALEERI